MGRRYTIKQLPPELRPRERLLSEGPEALSSAELLGILFGTGSKETTAVELLGRSSPRVATSSDCTESRYNSQNTKRSELRFCAVVGSGASQFRFERTTLS